MGKDKISVNAEVAKTSSEKKIKLSFWKKHWPKFVWGFIGLLFVAFLGRVALWEYNYYRNKEGEERATVVVGRSDVDETEITEFQVAEYTVAADRPRYLSIEKLGVKNARVLPMGVDNKGELATPNNIFDVGWYMSSGKPGEGGTMVIDGHNGGPTKVGVFKYLPNLSAGDIITIERGDGTVFNYEIVENDTVPLSEANEYMMKKSQSSPVEGKESITLITCTGEWSQKQQTYLSRQFVRAVLSDK